MKILPIPLVIVLVFVAGRTFNANAQTETVLYSFGSSLDGAEPYAGLVQGSDSNFYGTTLFGGTNGLGGYGTVFRISPSGSYTTLYSFAGSPANDGSYPQAVLVQNSDSNFYGTTIEGGTSANCNGGCGTVFRISPSGSYTTLYSFAGSPDDGAEPYAGLVQGSDSNFYGTTKYGGTAGTGGTNGYGTVFRISPSGTHTTLYSFSGYPTDGSYPQAGLAQGSDSNFYGTTKYGGTNYDVAGLGYGTVFRISPSGTHTTLYSFSGYPTDGSEPDAGLVQGSDSDFYGTTEYGGTNYDVAGLGYGTVFRISPTGTHTTLYSFAGSPNDGSAPSAGLVRGSDSDFYGTTIEGGTNANCNGGCGTVFRISPSGTHTTLYSFAGSPDNDGSEPDAGLVQGSDGNFYGTTTGGGTNGHGTVFELDVGGGGTNCTFSITSNSANFSAAGGSCNVGVTASNGCTWTGSTTNSWITINSDSGSGTGTVSYSVAANTSATNRSGTITVAGQTFTVNQLGATPVTYSFSTPVQTLKTKLDKKTGVTTTNCMITVDLVIQNTGTAEAAKSSVLLWLDQWCAFNPSVGLASLTEKVKALKADKSVTIKIKTKKLTGDLAGTFIFATGTDTNILASAEIPSP